MNLDDLKITADKAIEKINEFVDKNGSTNPINSIKNQMLFIRNSASEGKHPVSVLDNDEKFTYSIIASRELASPEELELYDYITEVSRVMDRIKH